MLSPLIEAATFSPNGAITAAKSGAGRIELCSGFAEGGLSPSIGTVALVRETVQLPLHVLIRPRAGDFVYDQTELASIEREISFYKELGVNGVVVGVLNENGAVNTAATKRLVELASPMAVTFHRAFDQCRKPVGELEKLVDCGVRRVLTSGGKPSVMEGMETLLNLVEAAQGRIIILPGGGVSSDNAGYILETLGLQEIHLSGKVKVRSPMSGLSSGVSLSSPGDIDDFSWYECDGDKIRTVKELLGKTFR